MFRPRPLAASAAFAALVLAVLLTSCAEVGPVLPPSAGLPRPVMDLAAVRRGSAIELHFTPPTATSDAAAWTAKLGLIHYQVCAWPGEVHGAPPPAPPLAPATPPQVPSPGASPVGAATTPAGDVMPPCPHRLALHGSSLEVAALGIAAARATLAVYAVNESGQGAGWSNPVEVSLVPVAPPPDFLSATPTAQGVELRWTPPGEAAIYRNGARLASVDGDTYLDATTVWNTPYTYFLRSTSGTAAERVESADSRSLAVTPRDVFPPPIPSGLEFVAAPGVAGAAGADLSWNAVTARDLAGYNV